MVETNNSAKSGDDALFVCYPKCSTCAKARKWLDEHQIDFHERNIKTDNPSTQELSLWLKLSGLSIRRFFNTSGQSYRALDMKDRLPSMSIEEAVATLSTDGMLVKRPILVSGSQVLVGFHEDTWSEALL
jgi:arsenate reductase